jgi:hypothetical protein
MTPVFELAICSRTHSRTSCSIRRVDIEDAAAAIGSKGYHAQVFAHGPYPALP